LQPPHRQDPNTKPVSCNCNTPAVVKTVQKDGPNKNRQFYSCQKWQDGCGFFLWADESFSTTSPKYQPQSLPQPRATFNNMNNRNVINIVNCHCNTPTVVQTVRKDGPNKDRQFFSCQKGRDGCDFFQWVDGPSRSTSNIDEFRQNQNSSPLNLSKPKCRCDLVAVLKVSKKV
ncbi:DNA topoisomerase 3-alpha, partial [Nowakowskiella sp. JEL0078]